MDHLIPFKLREAINAKKVLIFVGAGVSKFAGLPLWKDIVLTVLNGPTIDKSEDFKNALESGVINPLYVLDHLEKNNKRDVYEVFEKLTSDLIESSVHKNLSSISKKIITTNYDKLIEHNTKLKAIDTRSEYNLQKLDLLDEFVLKIHGSCDAIDNCIIFTSDYDRLYGDKSCLAKFQLQKLLSSHTCLFVGFSLTDHYITNLFNYLSELYNGLGPIHYVIATDKLNHKFVETITVSSYVEVAALVSYLANISNISPIRENHVTSQNLNSDTTHIENEIGNAEAQFLVKQDTPPKIEHWAGRFDELKALGMEHKICFITGIGGQGKSALASKFLSDTNRSVFSFCDWRDFKEEDLNFQSKLYGLIEVVSNGAINIRNLIGLETTQLIDKFFDCLGVQRGIFVFDNIDKYIDLERFLPAGDMKTFFDKVLHTSHNAKFIFTCRPFIQFAGVGSYQIRLEGLKISDTEDLIFKYHPKLLKNELTEMAYRLHKYTRGHPLWMALVLAQSRVDPKQMYKVLDKLERRAITDSNDNFSGIVSATVLEDLWQGLKEREKVILRILSISGIAESEEAISKMAEKKINYNQYSKAIKSLKALNLVILKEDGYLELHPLVREFISSNYGREEQESYIGLYVSYLDGIIFYIRKKFGSVLQPEDIENILKKVDILIGAGKTQLALDELRIVGGSLLISGYTEDFLRLSDALMNSFSWGYKNISSLKGFLEFISLFFRKSSEFGQIELFNKTMENFTSIYKTPDTHMILAKSALCHKAWILEDFETAIREGKSASDLIDVLQEKDIWQGKHAFNLALRDSKDQKNVKEALNFFCDGKSIHQLLTDEPDKNSASKYGNIGRCLSYQGNYHDSLVLLCKSYKQLIQDESSYADKHNVGYAAQWISEILREKGKSRESIYFLLHARNIWKNDMPGEANKIDLLLEKMTQSAELQSMISLESWQIAKHCSELADRYLHKLPKTIPTD